MWKVKKPQKKTIMVRYKFYIYLYFDIYNKNINKLYDVT